MAWKHHPLYILRRKFVNHTAHSPPYTDNYHEISLLESNPIPLDGTEDTMGDDSTTEKQTKKRKSKWNVPYSKMSILEAEDRHLAG